MKEPTRLCTSCRCRKSKSDLFRVVSDSNHLVLDIKKTADGRGAYVCKNEECIRLASKRHSLERSLKAESDEEIYDQLVQALKSGE